MHEILKVFMWRIVSNVIPTKFLVQSRIGREGEAFYGAQDEIIMHIFKDCQVRAITFASQWSIRLDSLVGTLVTLLNFVYPWKRTK